MPAPKLPFPPTLTINLQSEQELIQLTNRSKEANRVDTGVPWEITSHGKLRMKNMHNQCI